MKLIAVSGIGLPESPTFIHFLKELPLMEEWIASLLLWEDVFFSIFIAALISAFFYWGAKKREMIPYGLQNFLEMIVENLRKIAKSILGEDADQHLPFLGTIFIYIFTMNIFSLIPFMKSPSSNLSISIGMALCVFARVQYLNIKNMRLLGYLYHMCGSPHTAMGWLISPLMFFIEILTQLSRPITLALRLTGNVMGEHALISIFALFSIAVFSIEKLPLGIPIQVPAMLFGLLTSLMQALVFTLLTTIYILLSAPHHAENHSK
jgi:F-type H+-transporting ATPase subunit a